MNKLNLLILLAAMIGGLSAVCPTIFGCRNCTDPTVCTDCEIALKYFLQNGTCVPSSVTACRQIDTAGNCVNCFPDHILTSPRTCTPVASIAHCLTYNTTSPTALCLHCQVGYRLQNNACVLEVVNCLYLSADGLSCHLCAYGYTLVNNICAPISGSPDPNCAIIDLYGTCHQCRPQYFFNVTTNICLARSVPHCESYLTDTNTCVSCTSGYYLNAASTCSPQNIDNCVLYVPNQNLCASCASGFTLTSAGLCTPSDPSLVNCQTLAASGRTCLICKPGYYLDLSGGCTPQQIPNCVVAVANQNACATCQAGYYLVEGLCVIQNIPNCLTYLANVNVCSVCQPNFVLSADGLTCTARQLPTIPRCITYTDNTQTVCQTCAAGYYLVENTCQPQNLPNCSVYVSNLNACLTCNSGFQVSQDSQGLCVPVEPVVIPHCLTYTDSSNATCSVCENGYYVSEGRCESQSIPNCAQYAANQNTCLVCAAGFYLFQNQCPPQNIPNCLTYVANLNQCSGCLPDFTLTNNSCVHVELPTIPNCQTYTDASQVACATCQLGFYLTGNACLPQNIPNCATYLPNVNQCQACSEGFTLINNVCVENQPGDIAHCLTYSDATNTVCIVCDSGYLLVDNTCQLQIIVPPNCAVASQVQSNTCIRCNPGYYLNGGLCSPVSVEFCLVYVENTNICTQCSPGYFLLNNVCVLDQVTPIPNCLTYTDATNSTCALCAVGYYLVEGVCAANSVSNCLTYTPNTNTCLVCQSGFGLNGNSCVVITPIDIPFCITYSDATKVTCITCAAGYYLSQNQCWIQSLPNCRTYVSNANLCATCVDGYESVQGVCQLVVVIIPNCATYSDATQTTCVTCAPGYYLINNSCQAQNIPQCVTYVPNANACAACASGFHLEGVVCVVDVPVIPNCNSYSSSNNALCAVCDLGYFLADNICQPQSVPNCVTYVPNFNLCTLCANGFRVQNGVCQAVVPPGSPNCAAYADEPSTECLACFDGFYLLNNSCLPQSVLNCLAYQPNTNLCVTCVPGFHVVQGFCISDSQTSIPNCATYTDETNRICAVCDLTYYLASNACLPQAIANCATYLANNNVCTSCVPGFQLVNNVCTAGPIGTIDNCEVFTDATNSNCSVCELSYYLSNNQCLPQNLPNCITYEVNVNRCTFCEAGYQVSNGLCVPIPVVSIPFCGTYTDFSNTTCTFCVPGYYLANNQCLQQNLPNCLVYTPNENNCLTCQNFFYRNSEGRCQQTVGCVEFENEASDVCIQCGGGTILYNGRCIDPSNPNCRIFQLDSLVCQVCSDGFYLDVTGHCTAQNIVGCLTYVSQANQCQVCNTGYTLTNIGTCNPPSSIPNCDALNSAGNSCDTCHSGFYPSADRTQCLPQSIANCVSYQANANVCTACGTGFQLAANGVCTAMDDGRAHCIVWMGPVCLTCDVNYWPVNDLSSCYAIPKSLLMVPAGNGNYDNLVISQGQIKTALQAGQGDSHDWVFNDLGNRRFYIGSADGNFGLTIRNGNLALEAGSAVTDQTTWEITYNSDGFFFLRNIATNLYLASADYTSTVPIEILFYVSS